MNLDQYVGRATAEREVARGGVVSAAQRLEFQVTVMPHGWPQKFRLALPVG